MSEADKAHKAAVRKIARVRKAGGTDLDLSGATFAALEKIPDQITGLTGLGTLILSGTKINDLAPLAALTAMKVLNLNETQVADLAPLAALTAMEVLNLSQTQVTDLAPLAAMTAMEQLFLS